MTQEHATVKAHVWDVWAGTAPAPASAMRRKVPVARRTGRSTGSRVVHARTLELRVADAVPATAGDVSRATVVEHPVPPTDASLTGTSPAAGAPPAAGGPPAAVPGRLPALAYERSNASGEADSIRRDLATAWGEVGSTWGFAPATARVHGYLLAHRRPLTEREIRLALGLSHRATSLALAESVAWGLVERVPEPRRAGSRGPAGAAWAAAGDHWRWFGRVVEQRRLREGDPAVTAIQRASTAARLAADGRTTDPELADLRDWLADFLEFVRLFDRVAALVAQVPPRDLERAMRLAGRVPDDTVLRMLDLLAALPDDDVLPLVDGLARLSPAAASRAVRLFAGVLRRLAR